MDLPPIHAFNPAPSYVSFNDKNWNLEKSVTIYILFLVTVIINGWQSLEHKHYLIGFNYVKK